MATRFKSKRLRLGPCATAQPQIVSHNTHCLPNDAFCHVCVAKRGLYAWRDEDGKVAPREDGTAYAFTHHGCGGCGECDACRSSLCCDGRLVVHVQPHDRRFPVHLECFATYALFVDYAPTDKAACAMTGANIKKSELRLVVVLPKHNGVADRAVVCRLDAARGFLRALRAVPELEHFDVADVRGVAELAPEHRDWALAALRGEDRRSALPSAIGERRAYTALFPRAFEANYPVHSADCKPRPPKARKRTAGQTTLSSFFKKSGAQAG